MDPKHALIVYYSRTGTTQTLAQAIRDELGCEIEPIADRKKRSGVLGYLRSGFDATFHRPTLLHPMSTNPGNYDLVIVGTPVWNGSLSAPVRTYLEKNRDRIRQVAFFCTQGGRGSARVFGQMKEICRTEPLATLVVTADEVRRGAHAAKVLTFASALRSTSTATEAAWETELRPAST